VGQESGLILITGPAGSGKSATLAAFANHINEERTVPIVSIEDLIEFLHRHKKATVLQRELYRDVPSFPVALQSSLRLPPHVIFLSELAAIRGFRGRFRPHFNYSRFFSPLPESANASPTGRAAS
jgi:twitching motility protein PilT